MENTNLKSYLSTIIEKATSGKYFLTICAGLAFVYATVTKILSAELVGSIIVMVFTLYFTKKSDNDIDIKNNT